MRRHRMKEHCVALQCETLKRVLLPVGGPRALKNCTEVNRLTSAKAQTTHLNRRTEISRHSKHSILDMCIRRSPVHPGCRHAATGTCAAPAFLDRCTNPNCQGIPGWGTYTVERSLCDSCIINGENLMRSQGLDPGVYCEQHGVSLIDLLRAHPGRLSR